MPRRLVEERPRVELRRDRRGGSGGSGGSGGLLERLGRRGPPGVLALASFLFSAGCGPDHPPGGGAGAGTGDVLVVVADDLGVDMLASYGLGRDVPSTPNIDALAREGVLFRNAWASPLCSPTRATLQTGRLAFRHGVGFIVRDSEPFAPLPLEEVTLPEMLDRGTGGAYAHAFVGKWHLSRASVDGPTSVNDHGYDHFAGTLHNIDEAAGESYWRWPRIVDGAERTCTEYATTANVDDALAWLSRTDRPFLLVVAFNAPHRPYHVPPAELLSGRPPRSKSARSKYKAMVEAMDMEIGRLLRGAHHASDDLTVLFLGDNGTPGRIIRGDPHALFDETHGKGTLYRGGVHVPLVATGPAVARPGSECTALVHVSDLFATIAEIAGVSLDDPTVLPSGTAHDSISLVPYLRSPETPSLRAVLYSEKFFPNARDGARRTLERAASPGCQATVREAPEGSPLRLAVCGDELVQDCPSTVDLRVDGARPGAPIRILVQDELPPSSGAHAGSLEPPYRSHLLTNDGPVPLESLTADAQGVVRIEGIPHQGHPRGFYVQAVEATSPADLPPSSNIVFVRQSIAVRTAMDLEGYKWISTGALSEELFHLPTDPREHDDLLDAEQLAESPKMHLARLRRLVQEIADRPESAQRRSP